MLSYNIEPVAGPNELIPSVIRFEVFDDLTGRTGQLPYKFAAPVISSRKVIRTVSHGEVNVVRVEDHFAFANGASENIQSAPDSVEIAARFSAERKRQIVFFDRYYGIVSRWRWHISNDNFYVLVEPGTEAVLEGWELGYGPINAGLRL